MMSKLKSYLELGKVYRPYGKLGAVALLQGERYYFFVDKGTVSMMPACSVENLRAKAKKP